MKFLKLFGVLYFFITICPDSFGQEDTGKILFNKNCSICHQASGAGSKGRVPPLIGSHWSYLGLERSYMPKVVLNGLSGEIRVENSRFDGIMPAFSSLLTNDQIAQILSYVLVLQGNTDQPAFNGQDIESIRLTSVTNDEIIRIRNTALNNSKK